MSRGPGNPQPKKGLRERVRSVYDSRFKPEGPADLILEVGEPVLVTGHGRLIGYRCKDGSVWRPPEQPVEEWLRSDLSDDVDVEWVLAGGRLRRRWR